MDETASDALTPAAVACPSCGAAVPAAFKFCGNCGHRIEPGAIPPSEPKIRDERRDVTILFADVSGFTAMSERLDPEQVHEIMNACFDGLGRAIQHEGGHIDKYIGDNVMALFGAPVAHEDDPQRAARAALAMQAFLGDFAGRNVERTGVLFRMRIGIHCGLVLAGNVGASVRRDYSVMGDCVNLASRMESAAEPGHILVSHEFMRRTRRQFAFGAMRRLQVKGKSAPVHAYELLRELSETESDPSARDEMPFVGRAAELNRVSGQWLSRKLSTRRIWVAGPSGIGKTRLVEEAAWAAGVHSLRVTARPSTARRPLGGIRRLLQAALSMMTGNLLVSETFESFVNAVAPVSEGLESHLSALWYLGAPDSARVPVPDPDPQTLRRTLHVGVARFLQNLSRRDPGTIIFVDDFDHCDPASRDLVEQLDAETLPPIIVAARSRPSEARRWDIVDLAPLSGEDIEHLLSRIDRASALPAGLRADLIRRADGVPLYVDEMLLKLVVDGVLRLEDGKWSCDLTASAAPMPESLFGAMVARADALAPPLRRLLFECSVQGPEFSAEVAAAVASPRVTIADVAAAITELSRFHLIDPHPWRADYWTFRQSLLQAACYETLLMSERKRLHLQTAHALEKIAGDVEAVSPMVLAHHLEAAESWPDAARANLRAAVRAAEVFSNDEAKNGFQRAIDQVARAAGPEVRGITMAALDGSARLHLRLGAYGEVERLARQLLTDAGTPVEAALGRRHLAASCFHAGKTEEAQIHLLEAVQGLDEGDARNRRILAELHFDLAQADLRAAMLGAAGQHAAASRRFHDPSDGASSIRLDMLDGRIAHTEGRFADAVRHYTRAFQEANHLGSISEKARACNSMGDVTRDSGRYVEAHGFFADALTLWERIGDAEGVAGARNNLANLAMSRGDSNLAALHHQHALAAFEQIGNVHGAALSRTNLAILAIEKGVAQEAIDQANRALELLPDQGNGLLRALSETVLAEGYLISGSIDVAERLFRKVFAHSGEHVFPLALASAGRGLGRVALARGEFQKALKYFQNSSEAFQTIGRLQEAARTLLAIAETQSQQGDPLAALQSATLAREQFASIGADGDATRAAALMDRLRG